jgi:hypothetical protein
MENGKRFSLPPAGWMVFGSLLMLLWSIQTAEAMIVWTDPATVKIRRDISLTAPKTTQTAAVLKAAKNEFEAFQLIVSADQGNLSGVNVTISDLTGPNGSIIPGSAIMIYKEAFINITTLSTTEGALGYWPDALIPKRDEYTREDRNAFPFSVASGRNQPVWIEIYVPQTAAAGVYKGAATVTATNETTVVVPIELTVWNFVLPSTSTLKSAYSIDYHLIPIGHGLGSDYMSQLDLIKTYAKANLLHRITGDYLPPPHNVPGGWDAFTAQFGPLMDGTERFPGGKLPGTKMTSYRMSIWAHETDVPFLREVAQRAAARGWIDRLFAYTFDEPKPTQPAQWQTIKDRAAALHQADSRLRSLVTTSIQNADDFGITQCGSPRIEPCLDLFTPTLRYMDNKPYGREPGSEVPGGADTIGNQRSKYGPEVWWYQACGSHGCGMVGGGTYDTEGYHTGWPAYIIDLPAMFNRVMQWQTFKYNVQGELYYDMVYAYGQRDPWVSQYDFGGNGDGTLYYPGTPVKIGGTTHIPIESIRLKLLREGMEDYEYMNMLARLGDGSYAERQVGAVVTRTYDWSRNPADLYRARENMALQILSHDRAGEPTVGTANFKLNYTPASVTVMAGSTASSSITLSSLFDFNAAVALTCSTPHPTVTCTVSPASVTPPANGSATSTLRIVTQSATPAGGYSVTVRAVSGSLILGGSVALTVTANTPTSESFDRGDSTHLGPGWNEYLADFGIRNNEVINLDSASQEAQWLSSLGPNQEVSADCRVRAAGNSCGVMARWVDSGNFYYLRMDPGLGNVALIKKANGVYTTLATANRTMAYNTFYRLRLAVNGNTLTAYFAGETTPAITVSDASLAGSFSGIRSYAAAAGATAVDRFSAVSLGGALNESFNRANSTSLGSSWNEYLLDFEINSNQLRNSDTAGQEASWMTAMGANQDVSVDCKATVSGNSCGVIARWSNASNFYYALVDPGLGSVALFKRVNDVFTRLAIASRPMSYNTFYRIRLVTQGTSLRVFFNGESTAAIQVNDTGLADGNYAGIRSYATAVSTTYFDNFKVGHP